MNNGWLEERLCKQYAGKSKAPKDTSPKRQRGFLFPARSASLAVQRSLKAGLQRSARDRPLRRCWRTLFQNPTCCILNSCHVNTLPHSPLPNIHEIPGHFHSFSTVFSHFFRRLFAGSRERHGRPLLRNGARRRSLPSTATPTRAPPLWRGLPACRLIISWSPVLLSRVPSPLHPREKKRVHPATHADAMPCAKAICRTPPKFTGNFSLCYATVLQLFCTCSVAL